MSAPGATPGPWAAPEEESLHGVPFLTISTDQPTGPLCRSICEVSATYVEATDEFVIDAEVWANAHQMRASPELYDACEVAFDFLGSIDGAAEVRDMLLSAMLAARGEAA